MNGFADHRLDEGAFGEKKSGGLKSFDAFRKSMQNPPEFLNFCNSSSLI